MNEQWVLAGVGPRVIRLTRLSRRGRRQETVSPVLTVTEVCRRLHKSRRHVYRYLQAGRLTPCARILGQWLFAPSEVARLTRRRLPVFLRPFFWDARLADLSVDRHRDFILARLLESGDRDAVAWALRAYPRDAVVAFLKGRGAELLSRRAWIFWAAVFRIGPGKRGRSAWRARGRHWGGIA